jgi:hypothetical protein
VRIGESDAFSHLHDRLSNEAERLNAKATLVVLGLDELSVRLAQGEDSPRHVRLSFCPWYDLVDGLRLGGSLDRPHLSGVGGRILHSGVDRTDGLLNQAKRPSTVAALVGRGGFKLTLGLLQRCQSRLHFRLSVVGSKGLWW